MHFVSEAMFYRAWLGDAVSAGERSRALEAGLELEDALGALDHLAAGLLAARDGTDQQAMYSNACAMKLLLRRWVTDEAGAGLLCGVVDQWYGAELAKLSKAAA